VVSLALGPLVEKGLSVQHIASIRIGLGTNVSINPGSKILVRHMTFNLGWYYHPRLKGLH
jgi:hypothetical protein